MNRVLERIVERTKADLAREPIDLAAEEKEARIVADGVAPNRFRTSLGREGIRIIAEVKSASPSAGTILKDPDVEAIALEYAKGGAAAISIVTEPHFFRGSRSWLRRAASASGLPVVMKDFIVSRAQVVRGIAAGADAVLLLASVLEEGELRELRLSCEEYGRDALVEVHDEAELEKAVNAGAGIIGVNNRDLQTFDVNLETAERLRPMIPDRAVAVSESGIRTREDIARLRRAGYSAFLVGETLMKSERRSETIRELCAPNEVRA
ncbi:MAG: indole-3-glycerol phosphate synthase TrpC [Thermoanaerobaculia bacterium]|nr:indole-3-glycerol phosphate synthase TrpC [Thermoanaerobaculia bacterium]